MKFKILICAAIFGISACAEKKTTTIVSEAPPIIGTWKLVSAKIITKGDTAITFPVENQEMIKIFNNKDFAFFKHNINRQLGDSSVFDAGAGTYTLNGEDYVEKLLYCNARDWENHDFPFNLKINGDTLIQTGTEKIDSLDINREIVEIYVKKK